MTDATEREAERRRHYRVERAEDLHVSVRAGGAEPVRGELVNVCIGGVAVRFPAGHLLADSPLAPERDVELCFESGLLRRPLFVVATVKHHERMERGRCYGFAFAYRRKLEGELAADLLPLFNRRVAAREAVPRMPVEIALEERTAGMPVQAWLADATAGGVGFEVPVEIGSAFTESDRVEVVFLVPGSRDSVRRTGTVRHRRAEGNHMRYGVAFDTDVPPPVRDGWRAVIERLEAPT